MKFKKSTQILFASALILATGVAVYEGTIAPDRQAAKLLQQQVFNFEVDRVATLTANTAERTLQFDRLPPEEDSTTPRWQFQVVEASDESEIQPDPIPAKEAYVSFLLDALVNAKSDRILTVTQSELGEYGLDEPQATIEVKLDDETTHQIQLGERDFSESLVYAIADVPTEETETTDLSVLLVSTNLENAIDRSLSEWQADEEETSEPQPTPAEDEAIEETEPTPETDASEPPPETSQTQTTPAEDEAIEETEPTPDTDASEPPPETSQTQTTPAEDEAIEETEASSEPEPEAVSDSEATPPEDETTEETQTSSESEQTPETQTPEPTQNPEESGKAQ